MKSSALLPSNLPSVTDRSNLSPSREAFNFYFYSNNDPTNILFCERMKTRNSHGLLQLGREALAYCQCASALISGNKALFVSVDLIGEKNQVILEYRDSSRPKTNDKEKLQFSITEYICNAPILARFNY